MRRLWQRIKDHFVPSRDNAYRPHLLRRGWLIFLLVVVLLAEGALVADLIARQSGSGFLSAVIASQLISLTNAQRVENSVGVLLENAQLDAAAQAKADDMAAKGYFSHVGPDGETPWQWIAQSGYNYQYAGENLAVRFVDSQDVVNAWMASPTHRANIVKPVYQETGIGVAQGMYQGQPATYVVQYFGTPAVAVAAPAPSPEPVSTPTPAATPAARTASAPVAVLGEQTAAPAAASAPAPAPPPSFSDSLARNLGRLAAEPRATTGWVLGGIAALLALALAFAFFHHIQIQSRDLLLPGAVVFSVAVALLALNSGFLSPGSDTSQAAGVYAAADAPGVVVGTGASTEY